MSSNLITPTNKYYYKLKSKIMYKQASQLGLRVNTSKGPLSVEQLWNLPMVDLKNTIKTLKKALKVNDDDDLDFLEDTESKVDKITELSFNILKDIYITKKDAAKALRDAATIKEHNQKILQLIASKKEAELGGKSIEELEALLK